MEASIRTRALAAGALLAAFAPRAHAVVISEVLYDATGSDNGTVFVELWGAPGTSLDGWKLEGVNGADGAVAPIITLAGAIPSDGFFVVSDANAGVSSVANTDQIAEFDFQNGPDSVVLRDSFGNVLDALGYGAFSTGEVFAGEGSAAPDGAAGESLARLFANRDTNDNLADFALRAPTPGLGPLAVPEARALITLAPLLAAFALVRRSLSAVP